MKSKKGFTLIELLAVIIILGVIMLIAIPSVTEYINSSRRKTYVATVSSYIDSVVLKVNSMDYPLTDTNTTYYIPIQCIDLEKGGNSPYGTWQEAYVVVEFTGNKYNYYWIGYDSTNMGIPLTKAGDITPNSISNNITNIDKEALNGDTQIATMNSSTCDATSPTIETP